MEPGLRTLLAAIPALRLLIPPADDVAIGWVHSSDLPDPSPFLEPGTMLLTTGTQFADDAAVDAWVEHAAAAGVVALGFGTEVVRTTPPALLTACGARGVPLVEVPYAVPFIAVIRQVADALAARSRERDTWSLAAQRALSVASLGNGGLDNVLRTLAVRLDGTVVLFDGDGAVRRRYALRNVAADRLDRLADDARRLLGRGGRASGGGGDTSGYSVVHTVGRTAATRAAIGVLAPGPDDVAARAVVTSAVAIAEVTLDRDAEVARVGAELGARAVRLLAEGRLDASAALADAAGRPFPPDARVVVLGGAVGTLQAAPSALVASEYATGVVEDRVVIVASAADDPALVALAATAGAGIGVSAAPVTDHGGVPLPDAFTVAMQQATLAADRAAPGRVRAFSADPREAGLVMGAASSPEGRAVAEGVLDGVAPDLVTEASVWLAENGQWEPAGRRLGLHRHVLRRHMDELGQAIGLDLGAFSGRAELWALLVAAGRASVPFRSGHTPG